MLLLTLLPRVIPFAVVRDISIACSDTPLVVTPTPIVASVEEKSSNGALPAFTCPWRSRSDTVMVNKLLAVSMLFGEDTVSVPSLLLS